jgi:ribosomal protein L24
MTIGVKMFNVGDRVQVLASPDNVYFGTVRKVIPGDLPYQVYVDGVSDSEAGLVATLLSGEPYFPFAENELVAFVEGEPKFKVGDRVSIHAGQPGDAVGTVHEVDSNPNTYEVWVDGDSDGVIGDELEGMFGKRTIGFNECYLRAL